MSDYFPLVPGAHLIVDQRDGSAYLSKTYDPMLALFELVRSLYPDEYLRDNPDRDVVILDAWMARDAAELFIERASQSGNFAAILRNQSVLAAATRRLEDLDVDVPDGHPWAWRDQPWLENSVARNGPFWTLRQHLHAKDCLLFQQRALEHLDALADAGAEIDDALTDAATLVRGRLIHDKEFLRTLWRETEEESLDQPEDSVEYLSRTSAPIGGL